MTVDIVGASRKNKEDFPVADNSKFETLSSYMLIAKRVIGYFAPRIRKGLSSEMLASDDAVSYVAEAIMMADWLFDENYIGKKGVKCSRRTYRNLRGLWSIKSYMTRRKRNQKKIMSSLNYSDEDGKELYTYLEADCEAPVETLLRKETREILEQILSCGMITEKQELYMKMYYLKSMSVAEISEHCNISRQAVHESIRRALLKIKWELTTNGNR